MQELVVELTDILYETNDHIARITINRPERMNSLRKKTFDELEWAFRTASDDETVGVIVLTGTGDRAFCSGGDQKEKLPPSYTHPRVHRAIKEAPQPVIAAVNGYAIGGGQVLQAECDLSIASETARFGQTGPRIGSFDAGFGAVYLARLLGEKKAREMWFLCHQYTAQEAMDMGLINKVVPPDKLREAVDEWCQEILALSPTALRILKKAFNHYTDQIYGIAQMAAEPAYMYHQSEESKEGHQAFLEKRKPNYFKFRK